MNKNAIEELLADRQQLNDRMERYPEERTSKNYRIRDAIDAKVRKLRAAHKEDGNG